MSGAVLPENQVGFKASVAQVDETARRLYQVPAHGLTPQSGGGEGHLNS